MTARIQRRRGWQEKKKKRLMKHSVRSPRFARGPCIDERKANEKWFTYWGWLGENAKLFYILPSQFTRRPAGAVVLQLFKICGDAAAAAESAGGN